MRIVCKKRVDVEFIVNYLPPNFHAQDVHIKNVGYIYDDEKLADLYSSCDVFLFSSWFEGFGIPPLEAMACGLPVVTTACGGVNDFAKDGVNALIVPPRNPKVAAEAVLRLLSNNTLAEHIKKEGLKTVNHFTWSKAIDKMEKIFIDSLAGWKNIDSC
jgi:glycosyltransferase involved in cell wall biosynthesis